MILYYVLTSCEPGVLIMLAHDIHDDKFIHCTDIEMKLHVTFAYYVCIRAIIKFQASYEHLTIVAI